MQNVVFVFCRTSSKLLAALALALASGCSDTWTEPSSPFTLEAALSALVPTSSAVGATAFDGRVTDGGAATARIALTLPAGSTGMEPKLAFAYVSQGGNGLLGVGWSIEGLNAISRCPRTVAQDGVPGGVNYDAQDRYCLDGERLIAVSGPDGADGTEYRTERESFSRVVSYGQAGSGPAWFKVWTKSGQTMEFGNTDDSRIEAQGKPSVRTWAISRTCNSSASCIEYSYNEDSARGEYAAKQIVYTRNGSSSAAPPNAVRFVYEPRGDTMVLYQAGARAEMSHRLAAVQTWVGAHHAREYRLSYQQSPATQRSRLVSVTECAMEASVNTFSCLPPTSLTWTEGPRRMSPHQALFATPYIAPRNGFFSSNEWERVWMQDVSGDGLPDLVGLNDGGIFVQRNQGAALAPHEAWLATPYVAPAHQFFGTNLHPRVWLADVTGDELPDVVAINDGGVFVHRNAGSRFLPHEAWLATPYVSPAHQFFDRQFHPRVWITDVNGDGLPDILGLNDGGVFVHRNTGSRFLPHEAWLVSPYISPRHQFFDPTLHSRVWVADVTGDGLPDIVGLNDGGIFVHRNTGSSFLPHEGWLASPYVSPANQFFHSNLHARVWLSDVNGDGLSDLVGINDGGIFVHRNTGSSFLPHEGWLASPYVSPANQFFHLNLHARVWLTDVNGDGLPDFVGINDGGIFIHRNTGASFLPHEAWLASPYIAPGHQFFDLGQRMRVSMVDVNGDSFPDLLGINDGGIFWHAAGNADGPASPDDLLVTVVNGLQASVAFEYSALTQPGVHEKSTASRHPVVDIQTPMRVASAMSQSDGVGGKRRMRYWYGGAKVDVNGRGFLGFAWTEAQDEQTGVLIRTEYRQDHPFIGLPSRVQKRLGDVVLSLTENSYASISFGGARQFPYVARSARSSYDLDGTFVGSETMSSQYDDFGNLTQAVSVDSSGSSKTTVNLYSNDTTKWFLGRLTRASVTSRLPDGTSQTRTSSFAYDAGTGFLRQEVVEPDIAELRLVTDYTFDTFGNRVSATISGLGIAPRTSRTTYDESGRFIVSAQNALGHTETRFYDDKVGALAALTGPNGLTTRWSYDAFGRKLDELRADGTRISWVYSSCDSDCPLRARYVVTATAPGSPETRVYYDSMNREVRAHTEGFAGEPIYKDTEYDGLGRIARVSRPYQAGSPVYWTAYTHDVLGRVLIETNPDGSTSRHAYSGLTTVVTNALGQRQTKRKNAQGQLVEVVDALGGALRYDYDPFANVVRTTDAAGNVTTFSYDLRGRKLSMADLDMGQWKYQYNAVGELTSQTDAKGQVITFEYDALGRLTRRTEPDLQSTFVFDTAPHGIGRLARAGTNQGYQRILTYDSLGRPTSETAFIDGEAYALTTGYDDLGRVAVRTYPTGMGLRNVYNSLGYLIEVRNSGTQERYWEAKSVDASGRVTQFTYGNGISSTQSYDAATGWLTRSVAGANGAVQNLAYGYDLLGNVVSREDLQTGLRESFGYDALSRLTTYSSPAYGTKSVVYDALGNIAFKSDVGTYSYGAKPHAVTSVFGNTNATYVYDANGNMLSGAGREVAYTSFNMPSRITRGSASVELAYDADHARVKRIEPEGVEVYIHPRIDLGGHYERETKADGTVLHKHHLYAGNDVIGVHTTKNNEPATTRYFHKDGLGSITVITNEAGGVVERLSYDAWGRRRLPDGRDTAYVISPESTHHGFTGHEHLDRLGLVHMNGRIYEPVLGRFLSADPFIQGFDDLQSYNRYSYVNNRPLTLTDPSGYFSLKKYFRTAVAIAVAMIIPNPFVAGFVSGMISSRGDLRSGILSAVTAGAFNGLHPMSYGPAKVLAHAAVGGVSSALQGGDFKSGFLAAGFAQALSPVISKIDAGVQGPTFARTVAAAVVGGTASHLGGGEFANGAVTGAFSRLFNDDSSSEKPFARQLWDWLAGGDGRGQILEAEATGSLSNGKISGACKASTTQCSVQIKPPGAKVTIEQDGVEVAPDIPLLSKLWSGLKNAAQLKFEISKEFGTSSGKVTGKIKVDGRVAGEKALGDTARSVGELGTSWADTLSGHLSRRTENECVAAGC
jgi:RHS repeat-associated protein